MLLRYNSNFAGEQVKQALVYTDNEHKISPYKIDRDAINIIRRLNAQGYEAYIVGGAVRDLLIGKSPKDFDIATSAEPAKIRRIFRNSRIIGRRFRLVHIFFNDRIYEVSTFRSTETGSIGNQFGSIEEDARRRDFTLNALYYDPINNLLIDYVGGLNDIKKHVLKPVIPLSLIFSEDPVRMIRAIKYAGITKSKIPFFVKLQMKKDEALLGEVSPSRLTEELNKILLSGYSYEIVSNLVKHNLYIYLQPAACIFIYESKVFKKQYLERFKELDSLIQAGSITRQGQALVYLFYDYIKLISKIDGSPKEVYSYVYRETRHFILPMNPQKKEFSFAVRKCMQELGMDVPPEKTDLRKNKSNV